MKVVIGSDHAGFLLKEKVIQYLNSKNIEVIDDGTYSLDSTDYPLYGHKVACDIVDKKGDFGIVICGTGIGISIAANKVKGIRCALVYNEETARLSKEHNNANVIALGARTTKEEDVYKIIDSYLNAHFEKRHQKRLDLISEYENEEENI